MHRLLHILALLIKNNYLYFLYNTPKKEKNFQNEKVMINILHM